MLLVYILGVIAAAPPLSESFVTPPCPSPWVSFEDSCFLLKGPETWADAWAACLDLDSEMVVPLSAQENTFVAGIARDQSIDRTWIACSYKQPIRRWECEGKTNEVGAYSNWDPTYNQEGLCGYVWGKVQQDWFGKWYNRSCANLYPTVCVKRPQPIPPTTEVAGRDAGQPCPRPRYYRFALTPSPDPFSSCLVGHVIREFVVTNIPSCAFSCIKEPRCRSINIRITDEGVEKVCQLNDSTDLAKIQQTDSVCTHYSFHND